MVTRTFMVTFASRVVPPPKIAAALRTIFGEPVDHIRVIEHSTYARLHFVLAPPHDLTAFCCAAPRLSSGAIRTSCCTSTFTCCGNGSRVG